MNDSLFSCNSVGRESLTGSVRGVGTGLMRDRNSGVKGMKHWELSERGLGFVGNFLWKSSTASLALSQFSDGTHSLCVSEYPFHLTRYTATWGGDSPRMPA